MLRDPCAHLLRRSDPPAWPPRPSTATLGRLVARRGDAAQGPKSAPMQHRHRRRRDAPSPARTAEHPVSAFVLGHRGLVRLGLGLLRLLGLGRLGFGLLGSSRLHRLHDFITILRVHIISPRSSQDLPKVASSSRSSMNFCNFRKVQKSRNSSSTFAASSSIPLVSSESHHCLESVCLFI